MTTVMYNDFQVGKMPIGSSESTSEGSGWDT